MIEFKIRLNDINKVKNFVDIMSDLSADGDLLSGHYAVDAKSIMGIFTMNLFSPITFRYHGDEKDVAKIKAMFGV